MSLRFVPFAPIRRASASVKIAKRNYAPTVSRGIPSKNPFKYQFAFPIRVHGFLWVLFGDGNHLGRSVYRRRRRKHEIANSMCPKRLEHGDTTCDIAIEKRTRVPDRFRDKCFRGEMEYHVKLVLGQKHRK